MVPTVIVVFVGEIYTVVPGGNCGNQDKDSSQTKKHKQTVLHQLVFESFPGALFGCVG